MSHKEKYKKQKKEEKIGKNKIQNISNLEPPAKKMFTRSAKN